MNPTPISFTAGALPQVGSEAYKQAQAGIAPVGYSNTINSSSLKSQVPLTLTTPSPSISNAIIEGATSLNTSAKSATEAQNAQQNELAQIKAKKDASMGDLGSIYSELGLSGQKTAQAEQDAGIPDLQKQSDEITNQIEARSLAYRRQIEDLDKTFVGSPTGKRDAVNSIQKDAARELADLSIIQNARNRNLATAQSIVDRKVQLMTEDLRNRAEYLKFVYSENKDSFDKKEQRLFEAETQKADRAYEEGVYNARNLEEVKLGYIDSLSAAGAPNSILQKVQSSRTPEEAAMAAAQYKPPVVNTTTTSDGKPLNATQAQAAGYANRMIDASQVIDEVGDKFSSTSSYLTQYLPNVAKSADRQKFEQAQRNFINAVLRRESGAVISDTEFENASKQYFPQPGDKPAVLEQKKQNRASAINSLLLQSGNAVNDPVGVTSDNPLAL